MGRMSLHKNGELPRNWCGKKGAVCGMATAQPARVIEVNLAPVRPPGLSDAAVPPLDAPPLISTKYTSFLALFGTDDYKKV